MKRKENYSLTKLVTWGFLLLFSATVVFSLLYVVYFFRSSYQRAISNYQKTADDDARTVSELFQTSQTQMSWIISEVKNSSSLINGDIYHQTLRYDALNNSISGALRISEIMDAVVILPKHSNLLIESHSMDETQFLFFLDQYCSDKQIQSSRSFSFLSDPNTGENTHLVLQSQVKKLDTNTLSTLTTDTVFITVPIDSLISHVSSGNRQILCYEKNGVLYPCASKGISSPLPASFPYDIENESPIQLTDGYYIVLNVPVSNTDFRLMMLIPQGDLFGRMWYVIIFGIFILGILLMLTVFGIHFINQRIHAPMNRLLRDIRHISSGNDTIRLPDSPAQEITEISQSVNLMLDQLEQKNELIHRTQQNFQTLQLLHKENQLRALQSQINPHFLYNTLECVRSIAFSYRVNEISDIINSIILIYRYSSSEEPTGTIDSEFNCCRHYANIMGYRFGHRYDIRFSMDSDTALTPIPRMTLQPLIENAINHGYAKTSRGGSVEVDAHATADGKVMLSVKDYGCGIPPEELEALCLGINAERSGDYSEPHIGLRNVHQRIRRTYGDEYGLTIESKIGSFTMVSLYIPSLAGGDAP